MRNNRSTCTKNRSKVHGQLGNPYRRNTLARASGRATCIEWVSGEWLQVFLLPIALGVDNR
jgi:hypothetical protein